MDQGPSPSFPPPYGPGSEDRRADPGSSDARYAHPHSPYAQPGHYPRSPYVPADSKAILSLVLGVVSFFTCALTAIPAVVLGFSAKGDIQRSGGLLGGGGLATAGIVTGLMSTFFGVVMGTFLVLGVVTGARSAHSTPTARRAVPAPTLSPAGTVHAAPATIGASSSPRSSRARAPRSRPSW
jgi:hypothetical protein